MANTYMDFADQKIGEIRQALSGQGGIDKNARKNVKEAFKMAFPAMLRAAHEDRDGHKDEHGVFLSKEVYLSDMLKKAFGMDTKTFLSEVYGIEFSKNSISDIASALLGEKVSGADIASMFTSRAAFNAAYMNFSGGASGHGTNNFNPAFRFLIPEIILEIVRTAYVHESKHLGWIASTITVANRNKITVPRIERGNMLPYELEEGQDIPFGTLKFGQKDVSVKEFGRAIKFTDQFLQESVLDGMALALGTFGNEMALTEDNRALNVLLAGEQSDGSESAPVIGVDTLANDISRKDLDRAIDRLALIGRRVNKAVGIDVLAQGEVYKNLPEQPYTTVEQYLNSKGSIPYQKHPLTSDSQILLLDSSKAMTKMVMGGMMVEETRNAKNKTNEVYFSYKSGFFINHRDARIVLDKSVTFAANPFPSYLSTDFLKQQHAGF